MVHGSNLQLYNFTQPQPNNELINQLNKQQDKQLNRYGRFNRTFQFFY